MRPLSVAVIVTGVVLRMTPVTGMTAAEPAAGMVTVAGTVSVVGSLDVSATSTAVGVAS